MKSSDIKFRVWAPYGGGYFFEWGPEKYWELHGVSKEPLTFQQCTGMRDVNDKEIYEGDFVILRYNYAPESYARQNIYEIIFDRGAFQLIPRKLSVGGDFAFSWTQEIVGQYKNGRLKYKRHLPPCQPLSNFNICQVIGNKFENPKLIK